MQVDAAFPDKPSTTKPRVSSSAMPQLPVLVEAQPTQALLGSVVARALDELTEYLEALSPGASLPIEAVAPALKEALSAALTGRISGVPPVMGAVSLFGQLRAPKASERVTVATALPESGRLMFFDGDAGFVPLARLSAAKLFPSTDAAVFATFDWLSAHGHSPRDYSLRVCLVNFSRDGAAELGQVA